MYKIEKLKRYLKSKGFVFKDNIIIGNLDLIPIDMINFLSNNGILLEYKK